MKCNFFYPALSSRPRQLAILQSFLLFVILFYLFFILAVLLKLILFFFWLHCFIFFYPFTMETYKRSNLLLLRPVFLEPCWEKILGTRNTIVFIGKYVLWCCPWCNKIISHNLVCVTYNILYTFQCYIFIRFPLMRIAHLPFNFY